MGLCRVCVYLTAAYSIASVLPVTVWLAAMALLCHLIGLTYIAQQEHLDRIGALWPLGFLAVPVVYGALLAAAMPAAWVPWILYVGMMGFALQRLRRARAGDVPTAVVTLIAGMSLLDAIVLAGDGKVTAAGVAVAAFVLTLLLQRWVSGT
jgi:hypothetical protein